MIKNKVAIIGSGREWSDLSVVSELGKSGYKVYLLFQDLNCFSYFSKYLSGFYRLPSRIDSYLVKLISLCCHRHEITSVICLDEDIKHQLIIDKKFLYGINFLSPDLKNFETALYKDRLADLACDLGVPVPKRYKFNSREDLFKINFNFDKPIVIKSSRGHTSLLVRYSNNFDELLEYFDEISRLNVHQSGSGLPIIQEYIGGPTYLSQAIVDNGKVKAVVPHIKYREWPISGGVTTRACTIYEPKIINYMTKILESLSWNGEAGMEWKYDPDRDDFFLLEMNPRFEGSVAMTTAAGCNLPNLLMDLVEGRNVHFNPYNVGVQYRWLFRYDFKHFLGNNYGIGLFLKESFSPSIKGELSFNDIGVLAKYWKKPLSELKRRISQ